MTELLTWLQTNLLTGGNQFLQGGLILGVIGGMAMWLKRTPKLVWDWFLRMFTISVDVTSTDTTYRWILIWLEAQEYTNKARRLSLKYVKSIF